MDHNKRKHDRSARAERVRPHVFVAPILDPLSVVPEGAIPLDVALKNRDLYDEIEVNAHGNAKNPQVALHTLLFNFCRIFAPYHDTPKPVYVFGRAPAWAHVQIGLLLGGLNCPVVWIDKMIETCPLISLPSGWWEAA